MHLVRSIQEYCRHINIPPPRHPHYDIRRFEDNMKTVHTVVAPFRHECYAIALRVAGSNRQVNGALLHGNIFFNSPYQVISWDILPDWKGFYILFDTDFVNGNPLWQHFLADFPFCRTDKAIPFNVPPDLLAYLQVLFEKIYTEYHSSHPDNFQLIYAYTHLLLLYVKRFFEAHAFTGEDLQQHNRNADIQLLSRFQTLIEYSFFHTPQDAALHSPAYYAQQLHVHPNYLNAVIKRITGKTARQLVHQHLLLLSRQMLAQTDKSIKEIAFLLAFREATHFSAFFRKYMQQTPAQYREQHQQ
ncbi:helix-turn-helix domain-containing protein [Chitinophaga japonensis]|uniref:AraC-like DNA-binding protein n=1 Tax=Chitinophaga japonensis TaxID=104662 RepID=A0A562SP49_CHIJA|nr:helix-turn-helix domain-containing protein [Chitinophaga japonensis]TWI82466.1 AraC-like DNA-binding protein [Chitinophaga japonensis]